MFGVGVPEMFVLALVAMLVFGPDKLPDLARQAGKFVRTVRQMAENAKDDLGREMGEDFSGIDLKDLDPREIVRRNFLDDLDEKPAAAKEARILRPGETPPFDPEST
jgi:sec-independent protein translocase protein TatB